MKVGTALAAAAWAWAGGVAALPASAIALPVLDIAGFAPGHANSQGALAALSVSYALIPCGLKLAAAGLLYAFFVRPRTGGDHEISIYKRCRGHRAAVH